MTTDTYTAPLDQSDDAAFRAWGLALSNSLTAAGIPKSADTGQIDWGTVTRSSANTMAGYEIRYLNDSLHGTKPCYIKIEFGSGYANTIPLIYVTAASATNGAGTVSGTTYFTRVSIGGNAVTALGSFPTFCCSNEGFAGFEAWRRGINNVSPLFFVCRICDNTGAPTTQGFHFYYGSGSTVNRTTYINSVMTDGDKYCLIPGNVTSTLAGSDVQVFRHHGFDANNLDQCVPYVLSYLDTDIGYETQIVVTPVGVTPRNYITLGGASLNRTACAAGGLTAARLAMLWE